VLSPVTITDVLAAYGALLATGIAAWDVAKYALERARLRVTCYVGQLATPGVGITHRDLLTYSIANTGGKPIVVTTLGGALRNGKHFIVIEPTIPITFPRTLQPGESITVPCPMPQDVDDIECFIVHDALGKQWKASTATIRKQLGARS
jgi:hypothetical protein